MKAISQPLVFKSISELMRGMDMPKPVHPLVALVKYDITKISREHFGRSFLIDFYKISFKKDFRGQVKYGQGYYDFEEGGLAFLAPNQLVTMSGDESSYDGFTLYFHSDLISGYQLGKNIHHYGFFSYAVNEALFLSDKEKKIVTNLFESITAELENNIDAFSQDVLVSQIELLLNHSNRFYNRQFLTRKAVNNDLINQMDQFLTSRFEEYQNGIPTVQEVADYLRVSPRYLTDMLKSLTGQNTQQHIHAKLIEMAKVVLAATRLSIAEVAYQMGFEHPQSFNKLFKRYTNISPRAFRQSLN
ncbi:AraC family transcriptional regulator [Dyadobacter sp. CY345]|uniref:helix-turn-helix domain-containing protein n=1 Tax=Dyadobacter sp. CY345 TaxID=2909335 RepID=UPI001F2FF4C8|nr:AraC family transcriptional regulator [Dyadobacter sp. CY345]MCF2443940.1 AraC family transcriptional regulator [Dyadobacter sp. CY345]